LIGFSVAMYITPGPNNVMVAASAANHGIGATTPHMFGIAVGFSVMLTLVCAGLGSALLSWPLLFPLFRWIGAIWLAFLAWQIATSPPPGEGGRERVLGFVGAAAFQWVNPKAWLIAAGAAGEYLSPTRRCRFSLRVSSPSSFWSACHACWSGQYLAAARHDCCTPLHGCERSISPWLCCLSPRSSRC
jgi:threonine/homoserine/homoserine lactone efflux protein